MAALAAPNTGPVASYSNIALAGSGKKGILKKLDNNYTEIILGAFAAFGNGGWLYDAKTAMRYIENDREFLALLQNGRLRSEWGHPRRVPGMSDKEWFIRICDIVESNTASQIRRIRVSMDTVKDERGRQVVAVIGEVTPSGPQSGTFARQLENPDEDVNYSIRCFAHRDFSKMTKHINRIITWDNVNDPGIAVASKYQTPSLESKQDVARMLDCAEFNLDRIRAGLTDEASINDDSFESVAPYVQVIDSLVAAEAQHRIQVPMPKTLLW